MIPTEIWNLEPLKSQLELMQKKKKKGVRIFSNKYLLFAQDIVFLFPQT